MRLLDTDILVDVLRGFQAAITWLESLEESPAIPGFVAMELIQGCRNARDTGSVEALLAPFEYAWPSPEDCERVRSQFSRLHLGAGAGLLDALIAACAMGRRATLCTFNIKHYRAITGLQIERPYSRKVDDE